MGKRKWESRIDDAMLYYNRERNHREKYRQKLLDLGESPNEYETFPEFLRRLADDYERRGK